MLKKLNLLEKVIFSSCLGIIILQILMIIFLTIESYIVTETPITGHYSIWVDCQDKDIFGWEHDDTIDNYFSVNSINRFATEDEGIYLDTTNGVYYFDYKTKETTLCNQVDDTILWKTVN
jgi:hypothetical protein